MRLQRFATPAALLLAITMTTTTAWAQNGDNGGRRRSRETAGRTADSGGQSRDSRGGGSRGDTAVRRSEPRGGSYQNNDGGQRGQASGNRGYSNPQNSGRQDNGRQNDSRQYDRRDTSRGNVYGRSNSGRADNRSYDNRGYSNRGDDNRGYNRGYSNRGGGWNRDYDRSSWRSRIRFGLGISIFAGRPFSYRFDYGWRPSFSYRYTMRPGYAYGGMSFLVNPDYAEVYVDGEFVGVARDFGGQPVPVAAGYHRIELYAEGFEPVGFDINVLPGQVIPYRGSLYQAY